MQVTYSTGDRLAADSLPRSRAISYLTFCPSFERAEASSLYSADVDEHVLASIAGLDESVTLLGIEPFDSSRSHAGLLDTDFGYHLTGLLKLEFQNRQFGRSEDG